MHNIWYSIGWAMMLIPIGLCLYDNNNVKSKKSLSLSFRVKFNFVFVCYGFFVISMSIHYIYNEFRP